VIARILGPALALAASLLSASAFAAAPPQVRYLDTDTSAVGSFVGVYGAGFGDPSSSTKLSIGSVAVTDIALWTDTVIIFRVPAAAKSDIIKVVPVSGQALTSSSALTISSGQVYVVSTNGSDTDLGNEAQPFRTLHRALTGATAGDTILVRGGTYDEQDSASGNAPAFFIRPDQGGDTGSPITIRGFAAEIPVLTGTSSAASSDTILALAGSHFRLARMEVNGTSNHGDAVAVMGNDIWLTAMELHNFGSRGVFVADVSDVTLMGNLVHDGGSTAPNDHALFLTGRNLVVRDNMITNLPFGFGIMLAYQSESQGTIFSNQISNTAAGGIGFDRVKGGNRIYNNVIANVGTDASNGCHCGLQVANGASSTAPSSGDDIYYNTFFGPGETAVRIYDRSGKVELHGNIFARFASGMLVEDTASTSALSSTNNLWQGTSASLQFRWGATVGQLSDFQTASKQETSSLFADPQFVNASTWDFHLQGTSPAIDHGGGPATDTVTVDFEGTTRTAPPDIGAFEGKFVDGGVGDASTPDATDSGHSDGSVDASDAQSDVATDASSDATAVDAETPQPPASDGGGCGCTLWTSGSGPSAFASLAIMAALTAGRRRRRPQA
jgi:hypothetical protein